MEKLKVLVEVELSETCPTFDSFTLGCAMEADGGNMTLFSFFGESPSVEVDSVSLICLFSGLLLLLLRSKTSGGIGLGVGDTGFCSSTIVFWVLVGFAVGAGVEVKLKTGILSTCNCGALVGLKLEETGAGAGGQGGTEDERSARLRPESVTLDFIFRLDFT